MKNVAIVTGGHSAERAIALKSSQLLMDSVNRELYAPRLIDVQTKDWADIETGSLIDKNNFSLVIDGEEVAFDVVMICIHGSPGEDGKIQGYFETMGIPFTNCDTFISALTFNKFACKHYLEKEGVVSANSVLLRKHEDHSFKQVEHLGLPCFIKPNNNGSSYGISKIKSKIDWQDAVVNGFQYDTELIIEEFMPGREFSNGAVRLNGKLHILPVTEIISEKDYFDYEAKYQNASQEITPADISPSETKQCQDLTKMIYQKLNAKGMIRVDYIKVENEFKMIEVNTIPGLSPESIFPQQVKAYGTTMREVVNQLIADALN